jgi:hypothetical protein
VVAASLALFALLAGITGTTLDLFEAKRQEQIAHAEASDQEKGRAAGATQRSVAEGRKEKAVCRRRQTGITCHGVSLLSHGKPRWVAVKA